MTGKQITASIVLVVLGMLIHHFLVFDYIGKDAVEISNNLTCPTNKKIIKRIVKKPYNNIQAPHTNVSVSLSKANAEIKGIDKVVSLYGSSMQPTIYDGNKVLLEKYESQSLDEGKIIGFNYNGKMAIHRIQGVYKRHGYIVTQGDNNKYSEKVNLSDVRYIVKGVVYD